MGFRGVTKAFLPLFFLVQSMAWGMSAMPYQMLMGTLPTDVGYNGYNISAKQRVAVRIWPTQDVELTHSQIFLMGTGYPYANISLTVLPEMMSDDGCSTPNDDQPMAVVSLNALVYTFVPYWYDVNWLTPATLQADTPYWIVAASNVPERKSAAWVEVVEEGLMALSQPFNAGWDCSSFGETLPGLQNQFNVVN